MAMGSAAKVAIVMVALCCVMFVVQARVVHIPWNPKSETSSWWPVRLVRAGDVIVFVYQPGKSNVVEVDKAGYDSCTAGAGARIHTSGRDHITLHHGSNYFISTYPYCQMKLKITVN